MATISSVDLSNYTLIARYDLPEPTRTTAPAGSVLAQEVSAVTYNADTDTLFVVGDAGTSIVQVTKTGQLIDSMTLAPGNFLDPEGLTYIGGGQFVLIEERDRQAVLFTYVPNTTLARASTQTVKLGTTIGNIGIEGISYDPLTGGFIAVKEENPAGIFQTNIDFVAGTATNGSPTTENSTNLFNPALAGLLDFAEVYALSNIPSLNGLADAGNLLVLSQASGRIVEIDRAGNIASSLTIVSNPGNPLSVPDQQHEGLTMDRDGNLYVVSENGGGSIAQPQIWVYAPSAVPNQAPTAVTLNNPITAIAENTSTATRLKVAGVTLTDDGLGNNNLTVTGADASFFEVDSNGLYIKAGTTLDFETKTSYSVTVNVDDTTVGSTPDATTTFTLAVTDVVNEAPPVPTSLIISEVTPWSSGNSPYAADWFEVTNIGTSTIDITGWKMDDSSNAFGSAVALRGVTSIAPGKSVIFLEGNATGSTDATIISAFSTAWFGSPTLPTGFLVGTYGGGGVGLSTGGDAVNLFDASGNRVTGVNFGASTTGITFENKAGLGSTTPPLPTISTLSTAGLNGAFLAADGIETGSPGAIVASVAISEVSPWSSGNSVYAADWFEVTNTGTSAVDITGWRMDDSSNALASAVALRGVTSIPVGKSVIFLEGNATGSTDAAIIAAFSTAWFGSATPPAGILIGTYGGGGVGLSTGGDAVNLFDATGRRVTGISFGASTTAFTFDNTGGLGSAVVPLPTVSTLSAVGVNATLSFNGLETGSPGAVNQAPISVLANNPVLAIAENTSTTTRIKVADLAVTDDGIGTNVLSLSGADASVFEIDGAALYLKANTSLNFEAKSSYAVSVAVNDATVGGNPDASLNFALAVTDVNEAPTAVNLTNTVTTLAENTSTATRIKVADLTVTDDALGTNVLSLSGADASAFEIDGNALYLKANTSLNFEAKSSYAVSVAVDDASVGNTPDAITNFTVAITDVNEAPTANHDSGFTANQSVAKLIKVTDLLANDTDPDANTTLSILPNGFSNVVGGSVVLNGDHVVFTPNANFSGIASFSYTVSDGSLISSAIASLEVGRTVTGGRGGDTLVGMGGDDNFNGGNGEDQLFGNGGNDTLLGGNGGDDLWGGAGDDILNGGNGEDTLLGDSGNDTVLGGNGEDDLWGGSGDDTLNGGNDEDTLFGDSGNDTLLGGNGEDVLWGGQGNDILNGGQGEDTLVGGSGRDIFVLARGDNGPDLIQDFTPGQDQIGLAGGLSFGQLTVANVQGSAVIRAGQETLGLLAGVDANQLTASSFVLV